MHLIIIFSESYGTTAGDHDALVDLEYQVFEPSKLSINHMGFRLRDLRRLSSEQWNDERLARKEGDY